MILNNKDKDDLLRFYKENPDSIKELDSMQLSVIEYLKKNGVPKVTLRNFRNKNGIFDLDLLKKNIDDRLEELK